MNHNKWWEKGLLYIHGLCLDAPLVAVVWSLVLIKLFNWPLVVNDFILLAIVIWVGYMADRGLDVLRYQDQGHLTFRHNLIKQNYRVIMVISMLLMMLACYLTYTGYQHQYFLWGTISLVLAVAYSLLVFIFPQVARKWIPRELAVSLFFTLAVIVLPVSRFFTMSMLPNVVMFSVCMVLCCWINLCMISTWEAKTDAYQEELNITHLMRSTVRFNFWNLAGSMLVMLMLMLAKPGMMSLGITGMVIMVLTYLLGNSRSKPEIKSAWADLIMLLPVWMLFV